jgi:hemerythrin
MNNTHFDELVMVQKLGRLISTYQKSIAASKYDTQQITQEFENWIEHSHDHFSQENALMREVEFPMYQIHSTEHERVLAEIQFVYATWKNTGDIETLANYVFFTWPTWFITHINTMDLITAQFAVMNGYSPNSAPLYK